MHLTNTVTHLFSFEPFQNFGHGALPRNNKQRYEATFINVHSCLMTFYAALKWSYIKCILHYIKYILSLHYLWSTGTWRACGTLEEDTSNCIIIDFTSYY